MDQFGTEFCDHIAVCNYEDGFWKAHAIKPLEPLSLHPAAHIFHYASTCFEGFKSYRWEDGSARIFRLHDHIGRMQRSAAALRLPVPDAEMLANMVVDLVSHHVNDIPEPPSSLYLRPTLIGTLKNIGAAAAPSSEAILFVLASPVGEYFSSGSVSLKLLIEEKRSRSTEQLGSTKTGGNYAAALGTTLDAKEKYGVDQVLFCPNGNVQETGAANFLLINDHEIITKPLDNTFLHGMTRDSVLKLAADIGYKIIERNFSVNELIKLAKTHEAALSGTAACLSSVGMLIRDGKEFKVLDGNEGPNTSRLQKALQNIQYGKAPDMYGWLTIAK
ncbi:MAG: branched chain amino acid aminotransferase [Gammaproteobacteria bacterium]|nr:branched chain amino acid aminotransferase [Gammaproteobacteria bacterium]